MDSELEIRVTRLEDKMIEMQVNVKRNTEITKSIKDDTLELIDIFKGAKVFAKIFSWTAGIAGAAATVWAGVKGFRL